MVFYDVWVDESHHFKWENGESGIPKSFTGTQILDYKLRLSLYQWGLSQDSVKTPSREAAMPGLDGAAPPSPSANTWGKKQH